MIPVGVKESLPGCLCLGAAAAEIEEEVAERKGVLADRLCEAGRPAGGASFVAHTGKGGADGRIVVAAGLSPSRRVRTRLLPGLPGGRITLQGNIDELRQAQLGSKRFKGGWNPRQLLAGQWPCTLVRPWLPGLARSRRGILQRFHSGRLCRHAEHAMATTRDRQRIRLRCDSQHRRAVRCIAKDLSAPEA